MSPRVAGTAPSQAPETFLDASSPTFVPHAAFFDSRRSPNEPKPSLTGLPEEILLKIFKTVSVHANLRVQHGDFASRHDEPNGLKHRATLEHNSLAALALTHRRFTPIAREVMVESLVVNVGECTPKRDGYREVGLLLKMFTDYPELACKVMHLRAEVTEIVQGWNTMFCMPVSPTAEKQMILGICNQAINNSRFSQPVKKSWRLDIENGKSAAFVGVLLTLLPRLETFALIPDVYRNCPELWNCFGVNPPQLDGTLGMVAGLANLKTFKFISDTPTQGIDLLPKINTIDIWIRNDNKLPAQDLSMITTLRICTLIESNYEHGHQPLGTDNFSISPIKDLLPKVKNLRTFQLYDDHSDMNKNIDLGHGNVHSFKFDTILDSVFEHHPNIEELGLPENWFRNRADEPRVMIKAMPKWESLRSLSMPECAVLGIGTDPARDVYLELGSLPRTLRSVRVALPGVGFQGVAYPGTKTRHNDLNSLAKYIAGELFALDEDGAMLYTELAQIVFAVPADRVKWRAYMREDIMSALHALKDVTSRHGVGLKIEYYDCVEILSRADLKTARPDEAA